MHVPVFNQNLTYATTWWVLINRFRQLKLTADSRQSDLQKEISVKQFELERMQMFLDETANNLRQAKLEAEKYQSKSEVQWHSLVLVWKL